MAEGKYTMGPPRCTLFTTPLRRKGGTSDPRRTPECLEAEIKDKGDDALLVNVLGQDKSRGISDDEIEWFKRWRGEVDQAGVCSVFDLALGWFSARGYSHREVCDLARTLNIAGEGSLDDFFQPLQCRDLDRD